jgi:hypothetical protein
MANRLAFDIGLHLDCRNNGLPDQEIEIRHMVMRACVIYDKYWALFLGRPTSIKNQDIGMDLLSKRLSALNPSMHGSAPTDEKSMLTEVFEQLVELMELAGRIVETRENRRGSRGADPNNVLAANEAEDNAYLHVINLDRQLQNWYRRLPDHLSWKPANIKTAPISFFLLHQQYHASMILLHRPWAKYGYSSGDGSSTGSHPSPEATHQSKDGSDSLPFSSKSHSLGLGDPHSMVDDSRTSLSRSICTQQAIRVARIFWQHRQRFDGRKISVTGIQHAGTASIALIAALTYQRSEADRRTYLGYLEILYSAVHDMSHTYHPASRMDDSLKAVLMHLRSHSTDRVSPQPAITNSSAYGGSAKSSTSESVWRGSIESAYPVVPARRDGSEFEYGYGQAIKRPRPGPSRRASEYARPRPPFFGRNGQGQPTPPNSSQSQHAFDSGLRHQAPLDSVLFSLGSHHANSNFSLDFLHGSAVDLDASDDRHDSLSRSADEFNLVSQHSESWAMGGLGGPSSSHPTNGYELPISEWVSGPTGLHTGSRLPTTDSGSNSGMISSGTSAYTRGKADTPNGASETRGTTADGQIGGKAGEDSSKNTPGVTSHADSGMEWMGSEGGLNALSPVSLGGLVRNADKSAAATESNTNGQSNRNHELDFFSF